MEAIEKQMWVTVIFTALLVCAFVIRIGFLLYEWKIGYEMLIDFIALVLIISQLATVIGQLYNYENEMKGG
jgi:hypothetical protein